MLTTNTNDVDAWAMDRRSFMVGTGLLLASSPWQERGEGCARGESIASDEAAIYCRLLARTAECCLGEGEEVGFAPTTFVPRAPQLALAGATPDAEPSEPASSTECCRPTITSPADMADTIAGMVAELVRIGKVRHSLPHDIVIPKSCVRLTEEDIAQFDNLHAGGATYNNGAAVKQIEDRRASVPSGFVERLKHINQVISFSPIAFNRDGSIALLEMRGDSGDSSSESYVVVGKLRSEWQELDWDISSMHTAS